MMRQYELVERVRRYNPNANEDLLNRAYVFAMKAHGVQKRASGDPFFSHPLEVAAILTDLKLDEATIVAAVLHDTIEDTNATREEIDTIFGPEIGGLVEGLTKLNRLDFATKHAQQAENFRKLLLAIADDARVLLIKLADRLHNMRTLSFMPQDKRGRIAQDTLDIYAPLAGRMGMQGLRSELEELAFRYLMPDAYGLIMTRLEELKGKNGALIARIAAELTDQFVRRGIKVEVKGRQKQAYSVWRKMERNSIAFEQLSDIYGFRILVDTVADCYAAVGVAHTTWPAVPGRFKDYISTPKQNDYRSIHTTVIGPGSQRVELQIRTYDMHEIAEYGIAAHALYKDSAGHVEPIDAGESRAYRDLRQTIEALASDDFGEVPRAHQARAVPGPGVLLHPQGAADRAAARRDRDRLCLRRPHRRRQFSGRGEDQWPHRAADLDLAQRRRGADRALRQPRARPPPGTVWWSRGARAPPSAARPAKRPRRNMAALAARSSRAPSCAPGASSPKPNSRRRCRVSRALRSTTSSSASVAANCIRKTWSERSIPTSKRSAKPAPPWRRAKAAGSASPRRPISSSACRARARTASRCRCAAWNGIRRCALPPRAARCRASASSASARPTTASPIYPIHSPALVEFDDKPELWLDVRWDLDTGAKALYPTQIQVTTLNEPGALGVISTTIGETGANIDNVVFNPTGPDFQEVRFDLQVVDIQHLNAIIAQLRDKPVVSKVERLSG